MTQSLQSDSTVIVSCSTHFCNKFFKSLKWWLQCLALYELVQLQPYDMKFSRHFNFAIWWFAYFKTLTFCDFAKKFWIEITLISRFLSNTRQRHCHQWASHFSSKFCETTRLNQVLLAKIYAAWRYINFCICNIHILVVYILNVRWQKPVILTLLSWW